MVGCITLLAFPSISVLARTNQSFTYSKSSTEEEEEENVVLQNTSDTDLANAGEGRESTLC